jgi:hypothetical protein
MPQWTIVAHSPGLPEPADDASVETQTVPAASGQRLAASIPPDVTTLVQARTLVDPASHATITPDAALASDEVARTRLFLVLSAILAAACGIATPLLSGGITRRLSVTAVCFLCAALLLSFRRALTAELLANQRRWTIMCAILVASSAVAVWFFGVFSPAPMVGTFGIYFLCLGRSGRAALYSYLGGAIAHLVPSVAFAVHLLPDPGLLRPSAATGDMLVSVFMVQVVFACTYALARGSQQTTRDAVQKLHAALLQVQKREALLNEANLELDQALQGGHRGPLSGRRVAAWTLGAVVGRGAMGDVYEARGDDGRRAAVKVLHRALAMDPTHVKRFLREAQIVSRMRSRHVVRLLDFGNLESAGDGQGAPPYIAMELLDGHDLGWHLRREGRMAPELALEMIDQLADALTEAAAADVVHRDLKPQNVFLAESTSGAIWKVLDFGVSKLASDPGTLTHGTPIGTPAYMAPEQARGDRVDARADVFSLACIAYRALTGRPAFSGNEVPQILFDACFAQPVRPGSLVPLGQDVERALALGLAKRPDDRLPSAADFAAALRSACSDALSSSLRARADALLEAAPWGSRPR